MAQKQTGMMFKGPLVRAILEGRKTQTRRLVKPQPAEGQGMVNAAYCGHPHLWLRDGRCDETDPAYEWRSPAGRPGDLIYVRETFVQGYKADPQTGELRQWDEDGNDVPMTTWYRATSPNLGWQDDDGWEANPPWRPSIHMPKELARIWLEVTGVRVERLQDISEADAIAEGAWIDESVVSKTAEHFQCDPFSVRPSLAFRMLWESTGASWQDNPWVWVYDFKTTTAPKE